MSCCSSQVLVSWIIISVTYLIAEKGANHMLRTALMWAALAGKIEAVVLLLARGADTLALDKKGNSAVEWALREGHQELSNVLRVRAKN